VNTVNIDIETSMTGRPTLKPFLVPNANVPTGRRNEIVSSKRSACSSEKRKKMMRYVMRLRVIEKSPFAVFS